MKRLLPIILIACLFSGRASGGVIVADLIDGPFQSPYAYANAPYRIVNFDVFIDPANTQWMALSIGTALRLDLPNLAGIPTIQSPQMNDAIRLRATLGSAVSSQITLDNNDAWNQFTGNQAIFYGAFPSVGRFNGFTTATYSGQSETGLLTNFFDATGPGLYRLTLDFLNVYGVGPSQAGHSNVYLLREVAPAPVPIPATAGLFATALAAVAQRRRGKMRECHAPRSAAPC